MAPAWGAAHPLSLARCLWEGADAERLQGMRDGMGVDPEALVAYARAVSDTIDEAGPAPRRAPAMCEALWETGDERLLVSGLRGEVVMPCVCAFHIAAASSSCTPRAWDVVARGLGLALARLTSWANLPARCGTPHLDTAHTGRMMQVARMRCVLMIYQDIYKEDPTLAAGITRHALEACPAQEVSGKHHVVRRVADMHAAARGALESACHLSNAQLLKKEGSIHDAFAVLEASGPPPFGLLPEELTRERAILYENLRDRASLEPGAPSAEPADRLAPAVDMLE